MKCCDSGYLVSATPHTVLYWSFLNFLYVFTMVWRCAYGLDIILELIFVTFSTLLTLSFSDLRFYESLLTVGTLWAQLSYNFIPIFMKLCTCFCHGLEMCMWFGYNPWINFCHFFHFVNFVIFWPQILWKCIDSGYLVGAITYTISCLSLCNFTHLFSHGLKMCMWFGFNHAINFCHFSTLWTFVIFRRCDINFTEVRSILLVLSWRGSNVESCINTCLHRFAKPFTNQLEVVFKQLRAVPDEKIWGSLKVKRYIFVALVGIGCFSIQWVVALLKNAVLWVSFVQMGSCGLLRFKYKEEWE